MKTKVLYVCQSCGAQSPRWLGKCPSCESWNSYVEESHVTMTRESRGGLGSAVSVEKRVLLKEIIGDEENRLTTGVNEFDCVMGGGIVPGSVTLIGGDPGIGKSSLALQAVCHLSQKGQRSE